MNGGQSGLVIARGKPLPELGVNAQQVPGERVLVQAEPYRLGVLLGPGVAGLIPIKRGWEIMTGTHPHCKLGY